MENGFLALGLDGDFLFSQYQSSPAGRESRREMKRPRHGAMTCRSGASAAAVSSNRTWSLPLPVAPWAMGRPFPFGDFHMRLAMSGRAMLVPRKYWPS